MDPDEYYAAFWLITCTVAAIAVVAFVMSWAVLGW